MPGVAFFASQNLWRRCGRTHTHTHARVRKVVLIAHRAVCLKVWYVLLGLQRRAGAAKKRRANFILRKPGSMEEQCLVKA